MELFKLFGTIAITNADANEAIDDTTDKAKDSESKISSAFKKIGTAVATYFAVDKIKDFGLSCINAAADAGAASSQFSQVFGDMEGKASKSLKGIADDAGIMENRMKGSYTKIAAFAKTTGMDTESALGLANRAMVAVADSAAFYDRSLEETTESLQSFLKGNFENDAALGLSCTETTRNAAANKLYGKSFIELSESQKQLTLLQMVEDANELSGALGQASRESDTWTNQTGNLQQAWTDFKAVIGENFLDIAIQGVKKVSEVVYNLAEKVPIAVEKFQAFKDKASEVGNYVADTLQPIFTDVKSVFDGVKSAVQPLIDKFSEYASSGELAEDVTNGIKDAADLLVDAYESIKTFISDIIQGFKDVVAWGREHETAMSMIAAAIGTVTTAIGAYNAAMAIKKAGGIVEIAQLGLLKVQLAALTVAETAHTVATNIATAATSAFGAVMAFVTSPITLVIVFIGLLIAAGIALYKNWDTVSAKCKELWGKVTEIWDSMKEAISQAVENIKTAISEKFESAKQTVTNIFTAVKDTLSSIWESIKNVVQVAIMFIVEIITSAFELITLPWRFIWENCKEYIFAAWEAIKSAVSTALDGIKTTISNVWNEIVSFLGPILEGIKTTFTNIWNDIKSVVETVINTIKDIITNVWNTIKGIVLTVLTAIKTTVSNIWNTIKSTVSSVINSIKSTVSSVFNAIKSTISSILNGIKSTFSSIWNSIKSTVSSVINGVKSTISSGLQSAFSTVSNILNNIKNKFSSIFESAKSIVKSAIDKIKGFFNFSWSLPKIKLPHFSISGKFSLNPPSIPHFSVQWYKKAMEQPYMFTKPTIFDVNPVTGQARGAGEAGDELMIGRDTMLNMIRQAVAAENEWLLDRFDRLIELCVRFFPAILEALNQDIVLDDGTLVGRLAPKMDEELGKLKDKKGRGR